MSDRLTVLQSDEAPPRRRRAGVRAKTESIARLSARDLARGRTEFPPSVTAEYERPITRADCLSGPNAERPCPWMSCKYHLAIDVDGCTGNVKSNHPGVEIEDLVETCALDVADRDGATLEEIGALMNITRERVRQIELRALAALRAIGGMARLLDYADYEADNGLVARSPYQDATTFIENVDDAGGTEPGFFSLGDFE